MSALPQKVDLLKWVEDQLQLDPVSKYILEKLARFADAEGCSWAKIDTLAQTTNCSVRTVQIRLRKLEEDGLIERTGRTHRLKHSTRSVPIYQLAPNVEGFGLAVSMGAGSAPIDGVWVQETQSMGAAICTRIGTERTKGESYDSPVRERARERDVFEQLEAAYPKSGLKVTDREAAWLAICALADQGVEIERLADCARAMVVDPAQKKRDYGPPSMQAWMMRGQYRGWWPDGNVADVAAADLSDPAQILPDDLVAEFGLSFLNAWAPGARWIADRRLLVTRLGVQASKFRNERIAGLRRLDIRVLSQAEADAEKVIEGADL
jgi:hypothetical protein